MKFDGKLIENIAKIKEFYEKVESFELPKIGKRVAKIENVKSFLKGLRVVGVDGSQISPLKDFGLPFGGVQAARLMIEHGNGKFDLKYRCCIAHESNLELERFRLEVELLKETLEKNVFSFFDGSFSFFYTSEISERLRKAYIREIDELIKISEEREAPVLAYVDRSYSKELQLGTYDSYVLKDYLKIFEYTEPVKKGSLLVIYFKVNPTFPARIEVPSWLEDEVDEVIKVVLAECLISSTTGYPYVLERVHKYASISEREKEEFVKAVGAKIPSYKFVSKVMK